MFPVVLVDAGFIVAFAGLVCVVKPLEFIGITTCWQGAALLASGLLVTLVGWVLPAPETRAEAAASELNQFVRVYQFNEVHSALIKAPREKVYRALKAVTADEIFLFRTLTWIRRLGRRGPESILNAPEKKPILEVATSSGFRRLAEQPERELVTGTFVVVPPDTVRASLATADFKSLNQPGFAIAAMNFRLEDAPGNGTLLTTETRVYATDASACRRFAVYWRSIYPGSALIRHMWLRAVKRRAEG